MNRRSVRMILPFALLALVILLWEISTDVLDVSKLVLPAPTDIVQAISTRLPVLLSAALTTAGEAVTGFAIATLIAVPLAMLITFSPILRGAVYPILLASESVPKIALAPIVLLWFGYGTSSRTVIVVLVAFFPIVINTALGLRSTPPELLELSRTLRSSGWQTFWKVRFPFAMPYFFGGLKLAIALSVVGAVISEFVGANSGLGYLVLAASAQINTPFAFASLTLLALLGMSLFGLVTLAERILTPWAPRSADRSPA